MPIRSIELSGFKRIRLTNIKRIKITFKEIMQLILGSNGAGKSALIRELSPLPASADDYEDGGYKKIIYDLPGHEYVLTSSLKPTRHSFLKDGLELNPGGTQSVQKDLVKQEFGITPEIRDLQIGELRFTEMKAKERREWFTQFADVDYDYALGAYRRLQQYNNTLKGALKRSRQNLVTASAKLISEDEQRQLTAAINELHRDLDALQEMRAPVEHTRDELEVRWHDLNAQVMEITNRAQRLRNSVFGKLGYDSLEAMDADIESHKANAAAKKALLDNAYKTFEKLQANHKLLEQTGAAGLADLHAKIAAKTEERNTVLSGTRLGLVFASATQAMQSLESVYSMLAQLFEEMPENKDRWYSLANLKQFIEQRTQLLEAYQNGMARYKKIAKQRDELEAHRNLGSTSCPKCGHSWIQGYSEAQYNKVVDELEALDKSLNENEAQRNKLTEHIGMIDAYRAQYAAFSNCVKAWPALAPYWSYLLEKEYVVSSPRLALASMTELTQDLHLEIRGEKINKEIDELKVLVQKTLSLGDENLAGVTKSMEELEAQIAKWTAEYTTSNERVAELTTKRRNACEYQDIARVLEQRIAEMEQLTVERVETIRREVIQQEIRQLQVELGYKNKALSEIELQKHSVRELERNIAEMQEQEVAVSLLMAELSPTDGLIAEGLFGSIKSFTQEMNALLRKVWSYPLEIFPCGVSDEEVGTELDYVFPMTVAHEPVPDVGMGSKGQKEIINLVFLVVAIQKLKLAEPALMLDEFGANLDEEHRRSAAYAIQMLIEEQRFSQIFMVSHYQSGYGALSRAEICVLCPDNILLPRDVPYNTHVTLDY